MFSPRWQKVLRDLWDNKSRTILVVLSIAVGVTAFGGLLIARETVVKDEHNQYKASNPYDIALDLPLFDDALVKWIATRDGVTAAQGMSILGGQVIEANGNTRDITILVYGDIAGAKLSMVTADQGTYPDKRDELYLERSFLWRTGWQLGDSVTLKLASDKRYQLKYSGTLHDINVQSGFINTRLQGYVSPRTLSDLDVSTKFTRLYVQTTPGITTDRRYAIANGLTDALREHGVIVRNINVNERGEHWAAAYVDGITIILTFVGAAALLLSGFLVVNVISGLLAQQKKYIGVMKIVGADRWQIAGVYGVFVAALGALAFVLAAPASLALGNSIANLVGGILNLNLTDRPLPYAIFLVEALVALLSPVLFAAVPIFGAINISAAQAISDVSAKAGTSLFERSLAKLEAFPRPLLLAIRNTFRKKVRLLMTLMTLTLAGALFISIINVRTAVAGDLTRSTGLSAFDAQLALVKPQNQQGVVLRAMSHPDVTFAEGWLSAPVKTVRAGGEEGANFTLFGLPPGSRFATPLIIDGQWLNANEAEANGEKRFDVVITKVLLDSEPHKMGDIIKVKYNGEEQTWRIVGVADSQLPAAYGYYGSVSRYVKQYGQANLVRVETREHASAFQKRVAAELSASFENEWSIMVTGTSTRTELIDNILSAFNVILTLLTVVSIMIMVIGGLGLTGTMSLSVMERTREVGVMRSVGAETPTLRGMFISEGLFIGLLSALLAFLLSYPATVQLANALGLALRRPPFSVNISPSGYLIWVGIIAAVSVAASLIPANRAAQISIREALAYE